MTNTAMKEKLDTAMTAKMARKNAAKQTDMDKRAVKEASTKARMTENIYLSQESASDFTQARPTTGAKAISQLVSVFHDPYSYVDNHGIINVRSRMAYPQAEVAGGLLHMLSGLLDQVSNRTLPKAMDKVATLQRNLNHQNAEQLERAIDYVETLEFQQQHLEVLVEAAQHVYDTETDPVARERRDDRIQKAMEKKNATPIDDSQLRAISERAARITKKVQAADDVNSTDE